MTTIVRHGQTLTTNGDDHDIRLKGGDILTVNLPAPYDSTPLDITSSGNNTVQINQQPVGGSYTADIVAKSGTLTLSPAMYSGANVTVSGSGHVDFNAEIGGRYGSSHLTVDAKDGGSKAFVIDNGSLTFDKLKFIQSADVTLYDEGEPVGNIGGPVPVLEVDGLKDLHGVTYSQTGGLTLDFAHGQSATIPGLHIADPQFYSLTQDAKGDVTIQATATGYSPSTFQYVAPAAPAGGHVFKL
jgi:hypothetical protein